MGERFSTFEVMHLETDLWIGITPGYYSDKLKNFALNQLICLRDEFDLYIKKNPEFLTSLIPLEFDKYGPGFIKKMMSAAKKTEIGPMSGVAGVFAEYVGTKLKKTFNIPEIMVENGGDLYLDFNQDITLSIFAGNSPLSQKTGIRIPKEFSPLGVCTSSGTVGHSTSFGKADAVMIACKEIALADSFATAFCNKIQSENDIQPILKETEMYDEILSCIIIVNEKIGVRGDFEMIIFPE